MSLEGHSSVIVPCWVTLLFMVRAYLDSTEADSKEREFAKMCVFIFYVMLANAGPCTRSINKTKRFGDGGRETVNIIFKYLRSKVVSFLKQLSSLFVICFARLTIQRMKRAQISNYGLRGALVCGFFSKFSHVSSWECYLHVHFPFFCEFLFCYSWSACLHSHVSIVI